MKEIIYDFIKAAVAITLVVATLHVLMNWS